MLVAPKHMYDMDLGQALKPRILFFTTIVVDLASAMGQAAMLFHRTHDYKGVLFAQG